MTLNWAVFKVTVTVTSNHTIALVLVGFLISSNKWWAITLPTRNNQGIGVGFYNKLTSETKSGVGFGFTSS